VLDYFTNNEGNENTLDEYFRFNAGFDVRTKTKLSEYNSRLFELLNAADVERYNWHYRYYQTDGKTERVRWYD
jgi:hypothetical protein